MSQDCGKDKPETLLSVANQVADQSEKQLETVQDFVGIEHPKNTSGDEAECKPETATPVLTLISNRLHHTRHNLNLLANAFNELMNRVH